MQQSFKEVAGIAVEAGREVFNDAKQWLGGLIAKADEWLADYGGGEE